MNIITVIGNGFDLQLGLKTSYTDFFKWLFEDKDKSTEENYVEIKPINNNDISPLFWASGFLENYGWIRYYLPKDYKFHCDVSQITDWWSLYFLENKDKLPNSNWCSIEEEIEKVFKYNETSKNRIRELDSMLDWHKNPPEKSVDFYGAIRLKNELYPKNGEDIFNYLLNELKKFEQKFIEYLENIKPTNYTDIFINLYNNIKSYVIKTASAQPNNVYGYILNFNYLFPDLEEYQKTLNVHGNISDKNIIFGIDETADVAKAARIFKKTYRKLFLTHKQRNLPPTCDYLTFFGHSLAHADYSYFQSLFDLYDIYGGKTKLIFFVNDQPRPDNPDLPKENVLEKTDAIYQLIHDYGAGTLSKQKGENLLHKLLLENRIQIVKVSDIDDFPSFDTVEIKKDEEKIFVESC